MAFTKDDKKNLDVLFEKRIKYYLSENNKELTKYFDQRLEKRLEEKLLQNNDIFLQLLYDRFKTEFASFRVSFKKELVEEIDIRVKSAIKLEIDNLKVFIKESLALKPQVENHEVRITNVEQKLHISPLPL